NRHTGIRKSAWNSSRTTKQGIEPQGGRSVSTVYPRVLIWSRAWRAAARREKRQPSKLAEPGAQRDAQGMVASSIGEDGVGCEESSRPGAAPTEEAIGTGRSGPRPRM